MTNEQINEVKKLILEHRNALANTLEDFGALPYRFNLNTTPSIFEELALAIRSTSEDWEKEYLDGKSAV